MIEVIHLTKRYGSQDAVCDLNFSLPDHGIIGLVGHNGSGKSTTMKMLAGCLKPTCGQILFNGRPMEKDPKVRMQIGYLPELPPLYSDMTVEEQMTFAARIRGIPSKAVPEQIREPMERLNVWDVRHRLISSLSKGYRQRTGFAQALIGAPPFLLLDEPTVGLDPAQLHEVREAILALAENHLVLLSSHILSEIAVCCSRLLILSCGKLTADDTLDNLIAQYSPKDRWNLVLQGEAQTFLPLLSRIPAVESFESGSAGPGLAEFTLTQAPGLDLPAQVFMALSGQGIVIRRLEPAALSLEDLFLLLTRDLRYEEK